MSEQLAKGYAPFHPGPRYKHNQSMIDAQARAILNGAVEKGWVFTPPAHQRAAEMRRARATLSGGVQKDAFQFGPAPGEMRSVVSARSTTTTKTTSHQQEKPKMSKADKAVRRAVAKSTSRSLEQAAARKAAATGLGQVAKAVIAPRLARIAELRKLLNDAEGDQEQRAIAVLLGREELSRDHELAGLAKLGLVEKSPGVPLGPIGTPTANARWSSQSGLRGPMTAGTHAPRSINTPGGETRAVGGSSTYDIPTEADIVNGRYSAFSTPAGVHEQLRNIVGGNARSYPAPAEHDSLVRNHQRNTTLHRDEIQDEIDSLQKQLDDALAGKNPARATELGYRLTKAQLMQKHAEGDVRDVPVYGGR